MLVAQSKDSRETPRHVLCIEAEGMELISWRRDPLGGPQQPLNTCKEEAAVRVGPRFVLECRLRERTQNQTRKALTV